MLKQKSKYNKTNISINKGEGIGWMKYKGRSKHWLNELLRNTTTTTTTIQRQTFIHWTTNYTLEIWHSENQGEKKIVHLLKKT